MAEGQKLGNFNNSSWTKENEQLEKSSSTVQSKSEVTTVQRKESNPNSLSYGNIMQLQSVMGNRAVTQLLKNMANQNDDSDIIQKKRISESERKSVIQSKKELQSSETMQKKEDKPALNNTGMPDNLKSGVENLSGLSMDDVRVHYNSDKPQKLGALAYTQGTDIHVGSGQEKHLPHEAWHVVQQKLGRVEPTIQTKGIAVNDDKGLEQEADVMGSKILETKYSMNSQNNLHKKAHQTIYNITQLFTFKAIESDNPPIGAKILSLSDLEGKYRDIMNCSPIGTEAIDLLPDKTLKLLQVFGSEKTLFNSATNTIEINIDDLSTKDPGKQCAELCHETFHFFDKMYIKVELTEAGTKDKTKDEIGDIVEHTRRERFRIRTQAESEKFGSIEEELAITGDISNPTHKHFKHDELDHSKFNENAVLRGFGLEARVSHDGDHEQIQHQAVEESKHEELEEYKESEEERIKRLVAFEKFKKMRAKKDTKPPGKK